MILSIDVEQNQTKFNIHMIKKSFSKLRIEGNVLNLIKAIYKKPPANILMGKD